MPDMSRIALANALRAHPEGKGAPTLIVITRALRDDIADAVAAGVNDCIVKPFTPQALKEKIEQVLSTTPAARTS